MSSQLQTDEDKPPIVKKKKKKWQGVSICVKDNREKKWDVYETSEKRRIPKYPTDVYYKRWQAHFRTEAETEKGLTNRIIGEYKQSMGLLW